MRGNVGSEDSRMESSEPTFPDVIYKREETVSSAPEVRPKRDPSSATDDASSHANDMAGVLRNGDFRLSTHLIAW
jgi:hypothetical protein